MALTPSSRIVLDTSAYARMRARDERVLRAACTIDAGAHLVSFDRDFEHVATLECTILQ
jgi:predicted nucleic acid-binding protein